MAIMGDMESWLAAIVESSSDAILGKTLDGVITTWNRAAERLFGYPASEAIGQRVAMLVPDDRPDEEAKILARIGRGERIEHFDTIRRRKDGSLVDVSVTISPVRDRDGRIVGASKIARDISERKRIHAKLQTQLGRLHLLDQITRSIGEHQDLQSIFQVTVRAVEEHMSLDLACVCTFDKLSAQFTVAYTGIRCSAVAMKLALNEQDPDPEDGSGLSRCVAGALVYEADTRAIPSGLARQLAAAGIPSVVMAPLQSDAGVIGVLLTGRARAEAFNSDDCEFLRQLSAHVSLAARHAELHGSLLRAYDDLRKTQQAAMQHERLRALGEMASGVAHDIKNALFPAMIYSQALLESEPNLTSRGREDLQSIARSVSDATSIVDRVSDFYRPREGKLDMAPVSLNGLVPQVLSICRVRWSDTARSQGVAIDVDADLADDAPFIYGSESEIREALINLVFNAVDAMPEGGALRVRTRRHVAHDGDASADGACVAVADTGIGMNEETRKRCLDPLFTTKGERGTGMGLTMVYGIAQRHGANLDIRSEVGRGTTIDICFPAAPQPLARDDSRSKDASPASAATRRLRVLVIDDDPFVLETLQTMLEAIGHSVIAADGGQAGIDAFKSAHSSAAGIEVVVTDLGMPEVDGRAVAGTIKRISPRTPVILLTGWGEGLQGSAGRLSDIEAVVSKPPHLRELRGLLDRFSSRT
jgi:PAS domain S-box-containing protein